MTMRAAFYEHAGPAQDVLSQIRVPAGLLRARHLPIRIARRYRLDETAAAHEDHESGRAIGNIDIAGKIYAHT